MDLLALDRFPEEKNCLFKNGTLRFPQLEKDAGARSGTQELNSNGYKLKSIPDGIDLVWTSGMAERSNCSTASYAWCSKKRKIDGAKLSLPKTPHKSNKY